MLVWLVVVICGYLATSGILFSTNPAHPIYLYSVALERNSCVVLARAKTYRNKRPGGIIAASYSRYSSDNQDSASIDQQQRKCREKAELNKHDMKQEFEFADAAVSGTRADRDGLLRLLTAAREGKFNVVYFESLSRLAREFVITMTILKELVYVHQIRIISTSENLDSDIDGWDLLATFRSWMHGEFLKALRAAVLRGQEEAVINDFCVGDQCFGFGSEAIEGSEVGRKGRNPKPRRKYVIIEEQAAWVKKIFFWFVEEMRSIEWIVRQLTDAKAPKDHRSEKEAWSRQNVRTVLRNRKYIGIWPWGLKTNVRNPLTGKITQEDRLPEEAAKYERERPHLRLIEDIQFFKAQAILDDNELKAEKYRDPEGKIRGSGSRQQITHLLQKLLFCSHCDSPFYVCGANGQYLRCSGSKCGACPRKTQLPRKPAVQLILDRIGEVLLRKPAWRDSVLQFTKQHWDELQRTNPNEITKLKSQQQQINSKIDRLMDEIERGEDADVRARLDQRRSERDQIKQRLMKLDRESKVLATPPTAAWVEGKLAALSEILNSKPGPANAALKTLIDKIVMTECTQRGRKRKYWQGRFSMDVKAVVASDIGIPMNGESHCEEITVDFVMLPKWAPIADQVKVLMDGGVRQRDIARMLKCPKSWAWKAWKYWHESRGLVAPDARSLRQRLKATEEETEMQDRVMTLWNEELMMTEIAERTGCCRDTVTAIVAGWHADRGLPIPDGRTRRKSLPKKVTQNTPPPFSPTDG